MITLQQYGSDSSDVDDNDGSRDHFLHLQQPSTSTAIVKAPDLTPAVTLKVVHFCVWWLLHFTVTWREGGLCVENIIIVDISINFIEMALELSQWLIIFLIQDDIGGSNVIDPTLKELTFNPRYEQLFAPVVCVFCSSRSSVCLPQPTTFLRLQHCILYTIPVCRFYK